MPVSVALYSKIGSDKERVMPVYLSVRSAGLSNSAGIGSDKVSGVKGG